MVQRVIVATDDPRIAHAVRSFGGEAMMTSPDHPTGTDRVAEVARVTDADVYVNVQGDEPEIDPSMIDSAARLLADERADIATVAVPSTDRARFFDPNTVKVVTGTEGFALYFSRSPLPGSKTIESWSASSGFSFLVHVGLYAFRREFLLQFSELPKTPLEQMESLEQLRALENGRRIKVALAEIEPIGVDTPDDYTRFVQRYRKQVRLD